MPAIRFSDITLETNDCSAAYPTMYCRTDASFFKDRESSDWVLYGPGSFDFTTYFNALSIGKLIRYASISEAKLHLEIKGAAVTVVQTHADAFAHESVVLNGIAVEVEGSDEWRSVDLDLQFDDADVLLGFIMKTQGSVFIRNAFYEVSVPHELHDVELVLATTTFKKESYIKRNIQLVQENILSAGDDLANHFHLYVIDNGQTLDAPALSGDRIAVIPNENVGGAGGFTRGMIAAMEQDPIATHILLMDDDVTISPESIRRTYNLLRIANDEYAQAFVSGAMLNREVGEEQWEDTGFMADKGAFMPAKPVLRLSRFDSIVYNESFTLDFDANRHGQNYAAWWYCVIPISAIKEHGLPLPVFVRCDDAEYGFRCSPKFMTMDGICVWHDAFRYRYNAAVERYQTMRNTLIARYTTGFAPHSDFMWELNNNIRLELKKFGYQNAELVLDAIEDFMKGPDYIGTPGVAEKTFMAANKNKEKMIPLVELEAQARELGLSGFSLANVNRQLLMDEPSRSLKQRLNDLATDNGQRYLVTEGEGYAVIPAQGWAYPAGAIHGKKYLILIDWYNRTGVIRQKDVLRFKEVMARYKKDLKEFKAREKELADAYSAARSKLTSVEFWKDYLGIAE